MVSSYNKLEAIYILWNKVCRKVSYYLERSADVSCLPSLLDVLLINTDSKLSSKHLTLCTAIPAYKQRSKAHSTREYNKP